MDKFWDNMMDKYDTALGFVKDLILTNVGGRIGVNENLL